MTENPMQVDVGAAERFIKAALNNPTKKTPTKPGSESAPAEAPAPAETDDVKSNDDGKKKREHHHHHSKKKHKS